MIAFISIHVLVPLLGLTDMASAKDAKKIGLAVANLQADFFNQIKQSVEAKGIRYFIAIDQQQLGASANLPIKKSTLVLFGTLDRMIPPEMGRLYCDKLPNCHLILVYDAAHEVDADRPEAFVSVASDFIQRHEGFLVNRQSGLIYP